MGPAAIAACLSLAAALRFYGLGVKGLWIDEAYAADLVHVPLVRMWRDLAADHVPVYYSLLWGIVRVIGDSEWALRVLSAAAGIVCVAGVWAIGREVRLPHAGLLAALLTACAPVAVYWSQEAKPEMLWTAVVVASWLLLFAARRRGGRVLWAGYWIAGLVGIYTFYYHVFVVAAQALALAAGEWPLSGAPFVKRWRRALGWLLGHAALGAALLPWLLGHRDRIASDVPTFAVTTALKPHEFLLASGDSLLSGAVWGSASITPVTFLTLLLVTATVTGLLIYPHPRLTPVVLAALALWVAVPLACAYALQLVLPAYQTRYLLAVAPALFLLFAVALEGVLRRREPLPSLVELATLGALLLAWRAMGADLYVGGPYQHQGFREVSAYIRNSSHGAALVAGDPSWEAPGFRYYLRPAAPTDLDLPADFRHFLKGSQFLELPPQSFNDPERLRERLHTLRDRGHAGIWLASYTGYPNRLIGATRALAEPTDESVEVRGIRAQYYQFLADRSQ